MEHPRSVILNLYQDIKDNNLSFDDFCTKIELDDILSRLTTQNLQDIYDALRIIIDEYHNYIASPCLGNYNMILTEYYNNDHIYDLLTAVLYSNNYELYERLITIYTRYFDYNIQDHITQELFKTYKSIDENDYMNKTTLYQPYMESLKIIIITSMNYEAIITDQLLYYIREIDRNYRTENYFEKIVQDNQVIIKDPGYD